MKLSIIIPTYNRCELLKRILGCLEEQSDLDFEVVVSIDGGRDHTETMLSSYKAPYRLKWCNTHCAGYGLAVARNLGVLESCGEIIAILDDDSFPHPDYVKICKESVKPNTISGGLRNPADGSETRQLLKMREMAKLPPLEPIQIQELRKTYPLAPLTECNIFMFRRDFIAMGMFSERLKIYGFIGQEFFARAMHFQIPYQFVPAAITTHDRQKEGAEGLNDNRKRREIMLAMALRESFMTPYEFRKQIEWAECMAISYPGKCDLPAFPKSALALFPYRFLRNRLGDLKRSMRKQPYTV